MLHSTFILISEDTTHSMFSSRILLDFSYTFGSFISWSCYVKI